MTKLSVNINKLATLRNSRGGNNPNLVKSALDIEQFGADGITVHPRPDERHIRYADVYELKKVLKTEFNIEGNPTEQKFVELVLASKPAQVTLVPDALGQLTSNHGWNTIEHQAYLKSIIAVFKNAGIRVSIFVDADVSMVEAAATTGTDRIELYTESYAQEFAAGNKEKAIAIIAAKLLKKKEDDAKAKEKGLSTTSAISVEWGNQIRSYVLHPYKMVKDHRTEYETSSVDDVFDGEIDGFLDAEINML